MKCRVHYNSDGRECFFDVEECSPEMCHEKVIRGLAERGLEARLETVRVDVSWPVIRRARVLMIPCLYNDHTGEIKGRNFLCDLALGLLRGISVIKKRVTGEYIKFRVVNLE